MIFLQVIDAILAILVIALVVLQSGKSAGMGGSIAGGALGQALIPIPGVGFMIGSALGGLAGSAIGGSIGDGIVRSDGSVTRIDSKDTVLAARPNGPIDKVLSGNISSSFVI